MYFLLPPLIETARAWSSRSCTGPRLSALLLDLLSVLSFSFGVRFFIMAASECSHSALTGIRRAVPFGAAFDGLRPVPHVEIPCRAARHRLQQTHPTTVSRSPDRTRVTSCAIVDGKATSSPGSPCTRIPLPAVLTSYRFRLPPE